LLFAGFRRIAHPDRAERVRFRPFFIANDSRRGTAMGAGVSDRQHMRVNMALYEHVFLARQDLAQAQVDTMVETATNIVTEAGGKIVKTENWGLRSIAYRVAKNRKAHYVLREIDAPAPAIAELERQTGINEDIIRFMTVRVDAHEQGPSAMMRRGERDRERNRERGDRDGRDGRGERSDRGDRGDRPRRDEQAA
jgi:small subunit ribosomal protein S6